MAQRVSWGIIDRAAGTAFAGVELADNVASGDVLTFTTGIAALSDGALFRADVTEIVQELNIDPASLNQDGQIVENAATVNIKDLRTRKLHRVTIPALQRVRIVPGAGSTPATVNLATQGEVLVMMAALLRCGLADLRVMSTYVAGRY